MENLLEEMIMVRDEDGNEMFASDSRHTCYEWCVENGIDGSNGEYIAFGTFNKETEEFDAYDYEDISEYELWYIRAEKGEVE